MAALIPKSEISKLCRIFEIDNFESFLYGKISTTDDSQMNLFKELE
jgi:hypothetical protein